MEIFDKISKKFGLAEPEEKENNVRLPTDPQKKGNIKITNNKPQKNGGGKKCCK